MYTYLIGWSKLNKWYYGVRYSKSSNPDDLWVSYFTSSKYVSKFRLENGEPDVIQVRKVFTTAEKARIWEHKAIRRIKAVKKNNWLNKTDNKAFEYSIDIHKKISDSLKGVPKSKSHIENLKGKRPHVNQTGEFNNAFKRYYNTPWGSYPSVNSAYCNSLDKLLSRDQIRSHCINNEEKIFSIRKRKYFKKNDIGKTFKELGFSISTKGNI